MTVLKEKALDLTTINQNSKFFNFNQFHSCTVHVDQNSKTGDVEKAF